MGYSTTSTVYDHIKAIRGKGYDIAQNQDNEYVVLEASSGDEPLNVSTYNRQNKLAKQSVTRKANKVMAEIEREIKQARAEAGPVIADGGMVTLDGNQDIIIPCGDDHFGDVVHDVHNNVIFNSDILESRIAQKFDHTLDTAEVRQEMGEEIDTVTLVLLGDHVTNEAIYHNQAWHVEETVRGQLKRATQTYGPEIERLSKLFPSVQVVCNHGNHGEFRVKGSSSDANADDFFFDRLELWCHATDLDNVTFIRSDRADCVNFPIRGGRFTGHVRHGQNVPVHIGTSSPLNTWKSHLDEYDFDIAFRGHYHEHREEPVRGRPVMEVPSLKNTGDYEAKLGVGGGDPMGIILGVSDDALPAWKEYLHF